MASSNHGKPAGGSHAIPRGFASMDPERQREIPVADDATAGARPAATRVDTRIAQSKQAPRRAGQADGSH
ncbi:MAG: stress-induced protein [Comamonadaceae bacterium]|nr:MAG: stress-induced protein [Comamonadaceae bacterium]